MDSRRRFTLAPFVAAAAALIIALAWFTYRTAPRGGYWLWDFGMVSEASRAWIAGENPYDEQALRERWRAHPVPGVLEHIDHVESLVPPPTLMVMSPFALLPRGVGMLAWYALQWALLIAAIVTLCSIAGMAQTDPRAIFLATGILLLGPVQSGVQAGQLSLPATACIVFAISFDQRDRSTLAGCLIALAMALKLQLAAPLLLYFALFGRWRTALVAACVFGAITVLAIARLQAAGVAWLPDWLANVRRSTGPGGLNDFAAGVAMDHLLNLQLPLYAITGSRGATRLGALILVAAAAILYATHVRRRAKDVRSADGLLLIAPLAVLTLLGVYHRYYDATILMIPLAWAIAVWPRRQAATVLVLIAFFIVPVGWATNLINRGYVSAAVAERSWWRILVMPMQVWLLTALAIVLIAALPRSPEN